MIDSNGGPAECVEHDPETGWYRTRYDRADSTSLTDALLAAISAATGEDVEDLPLLYDVIDMDALAALFRSRVNDSSRTDGHVTFTFAGQRATVHADGEIVVRPLDRVEE